MRFPRSLGSRLYLFHVTAVAVGLLLMALGWWRWGVAVVGGSFMVAAVARVIIPIEQMGMLRVRGKTFDTVWMSVLGVSLVSLALVVPAG